MVGALLTVDHVYKHQKNIHRRVLVTLDGLRILFAATRGAEPETTFLNVSDLRIDVIPGDDVLGQHSTTSVMIPAGVPLVDANHTPRDVMLSELSSENGV
jgi:hypothetical protein